MNHKAIFIVEDDPEFGPTLARALKARGYQATNFDRCDRAFEALRFAESKPDTQPFLIIVDHLMPDQLGGEFCRKVREIDAYRNIKMVLMSGMDAQGILQNDAKQKYRCNSFLKKPFQTEQLLELFESSTANSEPSESRTVVYAQAGTAKVFPDTGQLESGKTDIPQIFCFLYRTQFTGRLSVSYQTTEKIYLWERGQLVHASSTSEGDRLKTLLSSKGWLKPDQLKDVTVLSQGKNTSIEQVLLQLGLLNHHQLFSLIEEQAKSIVMSAFLLENEPYRFMRESHLSSDQLRLSLDFHKLLVSGIEMAYDEERLTTMLGGLHVAPKLVTGWDKNQTQLKLGPNEIRVTTLVDGRKSLEQILGDSNLSAQETLQVLYILYCLGFLVV